ncbi:MAG: Alkaline phosphatase, partial [uncultured Acetobacteraceae bacterium]
GGHRRHQRRGPADRRRGERHPPQQRRRRRGPGRGGLRHLRAQPRPRLLRGDQPLRGGVRVPPRRGLDAELRRGHRVGLRELPDRLVQHDGDGVGRRPDGALQLRPQPRADGGRRQAARRLRRRQHQRRRRRRHRRRRPRERPAGRRRRHGRAARGRRRGRVRVPRRRGRRRPGGGFPGRPRPHRGPHRPRLRDLGLRGQRRRRQDGHLGAVGLGRRRRVPARRVRGRGGRAAGL